MAYAPKKKKKSLWDNIVDTLGGAADAIVPGDQSNWRSETTRQNNAPVAPVVRDSPLQVEQARPSSNILNVGKPMTFNDDDELEVTQARPQAITQPAPLDTKAVDDRLNRGYSWEQIAKETKQDVNKIKEYSQKTRPTYGIKEQPKQQYTDFDMINGKNKQIFGVDVSGVAETLGGSGKTYDMKVGRKTELSEQDFLKGYDYVGKKNEQAQNLYTNKLKEMAQSGDENAKFTLNTLQKNGKLKGDWTDVIESANNEFLGGLTRSGARAIELLPGDQGTGKWADNQEKVWKGSSDKDKLGENIGKAERIAFDVGTAIVPAGAVDKVMKGSKVVQGLSQGGNASKVLGYGARIIPGSSIYAGVDIASQASQGEDFDPARSAAIGIGADLALPVAGRVISKVPGVKQAGGAIVDGAGKLVKQTGNVIDAGKTTVKDTGLKIRNKYDDMIDAANERYVANNPGTGFVPQRVARESRKNTVKVTQPPAPQAKPETVFTTDTVSDEGLAQWNKQLEEKAAAGYPSARSQLNEVQAEMQKRAELRANTQANRVKIPEYTPTNPIDDLSHNAKNSLLNDTTGIKPNGIDRSGQFVENGTARPIEYRTLEDGSTVIVDGRHTLEYARQNGITDFPTKDVTEQYAPATVNKRAIDADGTLERLRQRAANPVQQPNIAEANGLKPETVERLVRDYGIDKTRSIIQRSSDATNIRNMDAFVVSEAQKAYGKVSPKVRVTNVANEAPEPRVMSDEELAAMEAAEFGTPNTVKINQATDAEERLIANKLADEQQRSQPNYLTDQQERQLAEQYVDTPEGRVNTATGEIVDEVPPVREEAPVEYPTDGKSIREPIATDAPLGKITETFYDSKKGNNEITYNDLKDIADTTAARAYNDFLAIGSDLRKVAQITQEQVDAGVRNVDEMTGLTPAEKDLWKAVQAEQDYMRRRSSLNGKEIGGDQGNSYWNRVSLEQQPTRETLFEGFSAKKPGSEMKRRSDEFALKADEISYSPEVISKYIVEHGDTKLLQEERLYGALQREYPNLPEEQIRAAAREEIRIQDIVNRQKVKIGAAGLGKKVTVTDGKVIDVVDEFNKVGDKLGVPKTIVDGTPRGLTNGARINSVSIDVGGRMETIADVTGMNQLRDSTAYAYTHTRQAGGDREVLANTVENRLRTAYNNVSDDDIAYAVESVQRIKAGLDDNIVAGRIEGIYRNAAKNQLIKSLHTLDIKNKTLKKDISDLTKQILREGTTERELSAKIVQNTLRAQNALFRKLNVSSALNELSDLTSFYNIYGKDTKIFTPDFQLVKDLGLGEIDAALEPYLKQIDEGVPLNKVLNAVKKLNEGTRFYKFVETYKAGVLAKTAKEFYSDPKNGGLVGDELTARILQDYRDFALPVDMFTKTFLDDYPIYTQYMTWGARNLEKEGKMLTGQFDAGVMKDKSTKQRIARDLYANIPAKTVFWLSSNGLKGTAIMTAFGLTDFTGLTNQDYSGIQEEDKSFFDKTTQWTNMSTSLSLLNTSIQALEKEGLKQKYADTDYNPYENANFGESLVNTYTPQFLKNALGAKDLQDKGYSEAKSGRVQYEAPDDPYNAFKSFVFGKNQTENAREYSGRENLVDRVNEGKNPFEAVADMAKEQFGIQETDYNRPLTEDYTEKFKAVSEGERTAILDGGRQYNSLLDDMRKDNPDQYNRYIESMSDHVSPEYWNKNTNGGKDLTLFGMMRDRKRQLQKDLGTAYDPLFDLPDDQAKQVLAYKSATTGTDIALRNTLNKEQWYKDFKDRQGAYFDAKIDEGGEGFKETERMKQWGDLEDKLSGFYYDAEKVSTEGVPEWGNQFPLVFEQKIVNDKFGFGSPESDAFFSANADAYKAQKEGYDKAQLEVINQMRTIEGYPPMSWEAYQQATKVADTDKSDDKDGYADSKGGGGKSDISPNAGGSYSHVGSSSGAAKVVKVGGKKVAIKKRDSGKKIAIKRGGKI